MKYFITAINTDSGKTLVSAIFTKALNATYWKPIQSGLEEKDSDAILKLISDVSIVREAYALETPMSPHAAAEIDGVKVELNNINLPSPNGNLVVEGAGGVLVPINGKETILDIVKKFDVETVLVSNYYLGSINHTLLTYEVLKQHGVKIAGIVFNGEKVQSTYDIIMQKTGLKCLLEIDQEKEVDSSVVEKYAEKLLNNL